MAIGVSDLISLIKTLYDQKEMVSELKELRVGLQKKVHIIKIILEGFPGRIINSVGLEIALQEIYNTIQECCSFERRIRVADLEDEAKRFAQVASLLKEHNNLSKELDEKILALNIALGINSTDELKEEIEKLRKESCTFNESIQEKLEQISEQLGTAVVEESSEEEIDIMREIEKANKVIERAKSEETIPNATIKELKDLLKVCSAPIELNGEEDIDYLYESDEFMDKIGKLREQRKKVEQQQSYRPVVAIFSAAAQGDGSVANMRIDGKSDAKEKLPQPDPGVNFAYKSAFAQGKNCTANMSISSYPQPEQPQAPQQSPTRSQSAFLSSKGNSSRNGEQAHQRPSIQKK